MLNLFFTACGEEAISFYGVNSSVIRDCVFTFVNTSFDGTPGALIVDQGSTTGNSYINDRFTGRSFVQGTPPFALTGPQNPNAAFTVNIVPTK